MSFSSTNDECLSLLHADSSSPGTKDLRIVLLGKTGSGKSSTGNTIAGREVFNAEISPSSVTKTCTEVMSLHDDQSVSIVDTPGVFDTKITNEELQKEIQRCIRMSLPGPHVFLLVIRLDVRFTEEEKRAVRWIKDNFGEEASKYTLVLFTRGDMLGKKSIETFIKESPELRELIRTCNGRYMVFDNTCKDNRTQVNDLFAKIDKIVQLNGTHYTSSLYEAAQKKIKSDERRRKCGDVCIIVGAGLLTGAAATAGPAVAAATGAVVIAEGAVALAIGSSAMAACGGVATAIGKWIKPKTSES